jgi:hypothetical protein
VLGLLVVVGLLVWAGVTLLIDDWIRRTRRPRRHLVQRVQPYHRRSLADEAERWLRGQQCQRRAGEQPWTPLVAAPRRAVAAVGRTSSRNSTQPLHTKRYRRHPYRGPRLPCSAIRGLAGRGSKVVDVGDRRRRRPGLPAPTVNTSKMRSGPRPYPTGPSPGAPWPLEEWVTVAEAANRLGMAPSTFRVLAQREAIPVARRGRQPGVPWSAVETLIARSKIRPRDGRAPQRAGSDARER